MRFQLENVNKSLFRKWKKFQLENGRKMHLRIGKKVQLQNGNKKTNQKMKIKDHLKIGQKSP